MQHLFYRMDVLDAAGVGVPSTYEIYDKPANVFVAGFIGNPAMNLIEGRLEPWRRVRQLYLGMFGLTSSRRATAEPAINNAKGVATLNMMKALTGYMNPDFLTHATNAVRPSAEAGNGALTNLWRSRAGAVTDGDPVDRRNREQHHVCFRADRCRNRARCPPPPCGGTASPWRPTSPMRMPRQPSRRCLSKSQDIGRCHDRPGKANWLPPHLACGIDARVSIVGNEFPAIQTVGAGGRNGAGAEVTTNLTADHQKINVPGMQGTMHGAIGGDYCRLPSGA